MKVKELIRALMKMDPDAEVEVVAEYDNTAQKVKSYNTVDGVKVVIGDTMELAEDFLELSDEPEPPTGGTYPFDLFIEDEIPYRLEAVFGVDVGKMPEGLVDMLVQQVEESEGIVDNDRLDYDIEEFLNKYGYEQNGKWVWFRSTRKKKKGEEE